ncbi:hypothetical protein KC799_26845, partial [candidate division KSB1 bacterium]|nr:hypothetical protein [candidate division KSB1 bacterium]
MILKNIFSLTLSLIFSLSAYGSQQHYMDGFIRYELVQTKYKQVYLDLTDINRREALQSWFRLFFKNPENKAIYEQA